MDRAPRSPELVEGWTEQPNFYEGLANMNDVSAQGRSPPPESGGARGWFIIVAGITSLLVVWTYILVGVGGVTWWVRIGGTLLVIAAIAWAWRFRKERERKQLEVLKSWADREDAPATASRRR